MSSCTKTEVDVRDDLVGSWSYTAKGSMNMTMSGMDFDEIPIDETGEIQIKKSDENQLIIGELTATINGDDLSFTDETQTKNQEGISLNTLITRTGKISDNTITIVEVFSGTWDMLGMMSGQTSGTCTTKYTKKITT